MAVGLASALWLGTAGVCSADLSAGDWVAAAENRLQTARSLSKRATRLVDHAEELKNKDFLYESERVSNFQKAGEAMLKAGDLRVAAHRQYRKAANNWRRAAGLAVSHKNTRQKRFLKHSDEALLQASRALETAVADYKSAAACFSSDLGNKPELAAAARRKMRETRKNAERLKEETG